MTATINPGGLAGWLRPDIAAAAPRVLRVAWLGRTSTDEQQDPTLSLPRQLTNCERALPAAAMIVARFYDVETSRKELSQRGSSRAWEKFDIGIHRDGGLGDLLAEAQSSQRRFDAVICESIDRIARYTRQGTKIEHDLEQAGIPLFAADEPIMLDDPSGKKRKRASQVLLRRTKQGVAEWYIIEMLEKSWDGTETHTTQGWNVGKPPYGYIPDRHKHPVAAKRAEGQHKTKLAIDPERGPVVTLIYQWRLDESLSYRAIAERLNTDLDRYPPCQPVDPSRAAGKWTLSSVREILINPKYTGHMVWNRKATKDKLHRGKNIPKEQWITSPEPTHPALVSTEMFLAVQQLAVDRAAARSRGSRSDLAPGEANTHRQTRNVYALRSYVRCIPCDRKMHGKTNKGGLRYYYCQPRRTELIPGHPPSIWLPERHLMDQLTDFFNTHVFGPDRTTLVSTTQGITDDRIYEEHQRKIIALRRAITDTAARRARLTRLLEEDDDPGLRADVKARRAELHAEHNRKQAELEELEQVELADDGTAIDLLDHLPELTVDLADIPVDALRQLLDSFGLEIGYDRPSHKAIYRVTISADAVPNLAHLANTTHIPRQASRNDHRHPRNAQAIGPADDSGADPVMLPPMTTGAPHSCRANPPGGAIDNCAGMPTHLGRHLVVWATYSLPPLRPSVTK